MSIFKEHRTNADRSAADRSRHKRKIEKAIRDGVTDIIAEESIIGQDGKKKIKIPVKGIKEWQFIFGENEGNKQVGSAPGAPVQKGQIIKKGQPEQQGQGNKAGNDKGEEFYEVEITLEELAEYLFDSLKLPDLEKKKFKHMLQEKPKRHGTRPKGIRPRLDKKESAIQRLKRKAAASRVGEVEVDDDGNEVFPFHDNDLRYHFIKDRPKEATNAVIFFMMDVSGSMTNNIKFIARSFFFLLYQFLRHKYEKIEIVFIAHTTEAEVVDEERFFKRAASGGTYVSSAPLLALDLISDRYHPNSWNVYAFHCTDGDNWAEDNDRAVEAFIQLSNVCQLLSYNEIILTSERPNWDTTENSKLWSRLKSVESKNMKLNVLNSKDDIWPAFRHLFGGNDV